MVKKINFPIKKIKISERKVTKVFLELLEISKMETIKVVKPKKLNDLTEEEISLAIKEYKQKYNK